MLSSVGIRVLYDSRMFGVCKSSAKAIRRQCDLILMIEMTDLTLFEFSHSKLCINPTRTKQKPKCEKTKYVLQKDLT